MIQGHYQKLINRSQESEKSLAILIDPDKFDSENTLSFLDKIPHTTNHLFVGGSRISNGNTEATVRALKRNSNLPVFLFPGDYCQVTPLADAILFLTLLSGRNPEYLIGQQVKAIPVLKSTNLEIIATGYLLLDGGNISAVERVTNTSPLSQTDLETIVDTALAGQYMGAKLIYLEAGSGAKKPVKPAIIKEVKKAINIPLIVGGGIRTEEQIAKAYSAGADVVVMGTAFET